MLAGAELVASYPRRTDVPGHLWTELLRQAQRTVDVLAFAGLFLTEEHPDWTPLLVSRAEAGSGRVIGGNLTTSDEASEVAWVPPARLDDYDVHPAILRRIVHGLQPGSTPHVD